MKKLFLGVLLAIILLVVIVGALELFSTYQPSENIHKNAPVKTVQTIIINAPPEKVYQLMCNVNQWGRWYSDVQEPSLSGAFQKGNSFDWKTGGLTIHSTIHTAVPYQKIGWSGRALGAFAIHNWTFTPLQNHTEVKIEESMEGWLVQLMPQKFQHGLEQSLQLWLTHLKTEAER